MSLLKLQQDTLYTLPQTLEVAAATHDGSTILKRFREQTEEAQSPFYSGYRAQVLAGEGLNEARTLAQEFSKRFETLLVLGIGGSALGTRAIFEALKDRVPETRRREIRIIDNLDPVYFARETAGLDWKKTAVAVISKSGGTIETMAQFSWALSQMKEAGVDFRKHVVAITDPKSGVLLEWARAEKVATLFVPPAVGGRFSVFTPVGIFPLAFAGLDVEALMAGAQSQFKGSGGISRDEILKLCCRLKDYENSGYLAHVLFIYASILRECGAWFTQLWGESLGKIHPKGYRTGSFPIPAIGATDQHSILQLLIEGSKKSVVSFVRIEKWDPVGPKMPKLPKQFDSKLDFAYGKSFSEILNAEETATLQAIANEGRPVFEVTLGELNEKTLGAWLAWGMDFTSMMGAVHGVHPYDQPGVELGKRILPELLK
jgi:glucose-6-phosphate isomerase